LAAPAAGGFGGFGAAPAAQSTGTGDGTRLKPEFVKPVWVIADPKQRVYAPPALKELDPAGNEVILPTTRQPKIVELLRVEEVRPTRTRPDGSRILDDSALMPMSDRSRGLVGYESGPRFVQSVAIGFSGLKEYTAELQRAAVSLKEAATVSVYACTFCLVCLLRVLGDQSPQETKPHRDRADACMPAFL
jgi:hypothetical protein